MAATNAVNHRVPAEVTLRQDELAAPRFTPRELRIIKEQLGRSFMQLVQDDGDDEKFAVMAWLKLRREGYDLDYTDMDDVVITIGGTSLDPTNEQPDTTSPHSAASGA